MKIGKAIKEHWNYLKYVLKHRWFVAVECWKRGLYVRGVTHDLSKFRWSEWFAYTAMFYGDYGYKLKNDPGINIGEWEENREKNTRVRAAFDKAWLLHQKRNRHHWQWWLLVNDNDGTYALPMKKADWSEMICDWIGAGRAIAGRRDPLPWYIKNRDKIIMHPDTRAAVEAEIGYEESESEPSIADQIPILIAKR